MNELIAIAKQIVLDQDSGAAPPPFVPPPRFQMSWSSSDDDSMDWGDSDAPMEW